MISSLERTWAGDGDASDAAAPPSHASIVPGGRLGRYQLQDLLGVGGMGVVFSALDTALGRRVALKVVTADRGTPRQRRRLLREARAMARLDHPNVVTVLAVGEDSGHVFIAMDLIEGKTLTRWRAEAKPSKSEVLRVLLEAGRGLAAAHAAGIAHRDFKPDNVMIGDDGRVYVLDFGLARALTTHSGERAHGELFESAAHGGLCGTPRYMAPEQIAGRECDERTDQFAFCVTAIEALFDQHPFPAQSLAALASAITLGRVRRPRRRLDVPCGVRRALLRGLSVNPAGRHRSMPELLAKLETASEVRGTLLPMLCAFGLSSVAAFTLLGV